MFRCPPNRINFIHQCTPLLEEIAARVRGLGLGLVPDRVRKRRLHDRVRRVAG